MRIETATIITGIVIGAGATLIMDVWNAFLKRAFNLVSLNYCMLGRWLRHMPAAFRHASIAAAAPKSLECATGWIAHYAIGISMALGFVLLTQGDWLARPSLLPALLYGIATVVFPFLVLQPALGLGIASAKARRPVQARLKSLATHAVYGAGLYICALAALWG
jgi:uncharacterized membrane protein YagU involved in acid resistance